MSYQRIKALFDRAAAFILLLLLSPFLIILTAIVFFTLGAPVFFRQERPGLHGRPFVLLKYRTMTNTLNPDGSLLPNHLRHTRLGRLLRSSSLDELPSLINILCGDMSFIGPRPLLMEYLPLYSAEQAQRHTVLPGLSGWSQINGRNIPSWEDKLSMDIWYVNHQSFFLDFYILLVTLRKVLFMVGIEHSHGVSMPKFKGNQ